MKRIIRRYVTGVLVLGPLLLIPHSFHSRLTPSTPLNAPVEIREEFEHDEHRQMRDDWFVFQRQYPFDAIPGQGRRRAWLSLPRSEFRTQAAGETWQPIGPMPITSAPLESWGLTNGRVTAVAVSP